MNLVKKRKKQPKINRMTINNPKTLFDKIWEHHLVDRQEDGTPTGGLNVVLTPSDSSTPQSSSGGKPQQFGGYKKPFQRTGTYGRR